MLAPMNLGRSFEASVAKHTGKVALFWGEREYSYRELLEQSRTVSRKLGGEFQVQEGDRVGIWLKNCPEFIPSLFGIFMVGAVAVPINNFLKPAEVNFILRDAGIEVLITDQELGQHENVLKEANPSLRMLSIESLDATEAGRTEKTMIDSLTSATSSESLAVIIYTSGTTGKPKGAMLSHANLLHNVESCRIVLQTVEADRFAVLLPLFHSYMLTVGLLLPLLVGGSIVLVKSLHPPRNVFMEIFQRQATVLPAIPPFYRSMVQSPLQPPLPLRFCVSGSAPLPVQVLKDFEDKFKIPLIEGYGLSEASPVVTKNPLDGRRKAGSIGVPITNVDVTIQDEQGKMLPTGEIGELCVRGGNVMMGYWKNPEETAKVMRGDWLLTGDIGYQDADGYFYITDRKKDMLLVNGINVYPREIEEILYQFPGVKEAAVIGKPDARKGELPIAFVSPQPDVQLTEKELQQFVRERLADYKVPRRVILMPTLPRNATGKILKTELRNLAIG
jgi:long-chain acyl-CoA synthetase